MLTEKKNIAVLFTCHNRKDKTLKSLRCLYNLQGIEIDFKIAIFLVDDGSIDGTGDAIKINFPMVNIIQGDGNLYWNRGMFLAWKTAVGTFDFDYYLWLNDDTYLENDALKILLLEKFDNAIVCGSTHSPENKKITYGGFRKNPDRLLMPNGEFQNCDYFNGNCVLISKKVFEVVGNLDTFFQHALGDFDYGLRAKKKGIALYVAPKFVGVCESHTEEPMWALSSVRLINRLKYLYSPLSGINPFEYFVFDNRHNGLFSAIKHFITIHLRVFFPFLNWKKISNYINKF
jgi:GT2 family glycosyltransferase